VQIKNWAAEGRGAGEPTQVQTHVPTVNAKGFLLRVKKGAGRLNFRHAISVWT
jgi:hypothetical protein